MVVVASVVAVAVVTVLDAVVVKPLIDFVTEYCPLSTGLLVSLMFGS